MRFPGKSAPAATASAESSTHGNGSKFSFGVLAAMLVCAAAFLGIGAPAASAAPEAGPAWNYKLTFGLESNVNNAQTRNKVALDSSGNIFAQQTNGGFVAVYAPSATEGGELLTTVANGPLLANIAIDQSTDALYMDRALNYGEPPFIGRWLSDGQPVPTYTLDPSFEVPQGDGFALDQATGDILVTYPDAEAVRRYDDTGTLVETISTPSIASSWILAMADGSFYVASAAGPDLAHYSGSGMLLGTISGVGKLTGISYDPVRELIVASAGGQLKNYSSAGVLMGSSPSKGGGSGTVVDSSGQLYEENESGSINLYAPGVQPGVEAPVVSEVTGHSAHLEAEFEPGEEGGAGEAPPGSRAHLEYSSDGGQTWQKLSDKEVTEAGIAKVDADLTGLLANLEYQVRVVAENSSGNSATSSTITFFTLKIAPEVETGVANSLGETTATVNGSVNPNGLQTTYHFEYGTTTSYGSRIPLIVDDVAGNQRTSRAFDNQISGLAPGTTYHYRIVAENSVGVSAGADRTFTTAGTAVPPRVFELVTPVDKRGALVSGDPFHVQAADDLSAFAVSLVSGPEDGESAALRQHYVTWRGSDGWSNWVNSDAPLAAENGVFESSTTAISKDFTKSLVISNRALAPGGIAGGGNLYIKDLRTGTYTFVAGAPGRNAYQAMAGPNSSVELFANGAPDFSWVAFWSLAELVPGVKDRALYKWSAADGLTLESRLPDESIPAFPAAVTPISPYKTSFQAVSADGSRMAFDLNAYGSGGVYLRENGQSTPISVSHRAGDEPSEVQVGGFDWITPDGRYVFFHSEAPLTEDTPLGSGLKNVYRYDAATGELVYLGNMGSGPSTTSFTGASADGETAYFDGPGDSVVWHEGQLHEIASYVLETRSRYMTDDGHYFAWVGLDGEVHLYDRDAEESACVSCLPGGGSTGRAHMTPTTRALSNRSQRSVLADGTVFFDTPDALLPTDHNGTRDVYSYKDGYLTLISPGNADANAYFADASRSGKDVYILTDQGILPQDVDGSLDIYDARVGGGFPPAQAQTPCDAEGCRSSAGTAPQGPVIGSDAVGRSTKKGNGSGIRRIRGLSKAERAKLAKGKKAKLILVLDRPGKVSVIGTAAVGKRKSRVIASSIRAKKTGMTAVPIALSSKGLSALKRQGSLMVHLVIRFGHEAPKTASLTLKSAPSRKGGSS